MSDEPRHSRKTRKLVAWSAVIGAFALVAVYVTERGDVESGGACRGAKTSAEALARAVPGFIVADPPRQIDDVSFSTVEGARAELSAYAGKPVLMNLWATWCAPCRAEMPAIDRLAKRLDGKVTVLAVNVDVGGADKPTRFLSDIGATTVIDRRDPKMGLFSRVKAAGLAFGLPATLLFDRDGCQIASLSGPADWDAVDADGLATAMSAGR